MRQAWWLILGLVLAGCADLPSLDAADPSSGCSDCLCCAWGDGDEATVAARRLHRHSDLMGLRGLAERDNPEAQYLLALRLYRGQGTPRDAEESAQWLRRAAFLDHPAAQYTMGLSYARGDGVEPDATQAARWYRLSADLGFGPAMLALAESYRTGDGVERDAGRARDLYHRVARRSRCGLKVRAQESLESLPD